MNTFKPFDPFANPVFFCLSVNDTGMFKTFSSQAEKIRIIGT